MHKVEKIIFRLAVLIILFLFSSNIVYSSGVFNLRPPLITATSSSQSEWKEKIVLLKSHFNFASPEPLFPLLFTAIRKAKEGILNYDEITFELAALMLADPTKMPLEVMYLMMDIHRYDDYKEAMAIVGLALVIASHFEPEIVTDFFREPMHGMSLSWNDMQRNYNRLMGFLRDEKYAIPFVERFESQVNDYGAPWWIDSQIAILDALIIIDYKSEEILDKVITRLSKTKRNSMSRIVQGRLEEVINTLEESREIFPFQAFYTKAVSGFQLYMNNISVEEMVLVRTSSSQDVSKRRDPVDIYENGREYSKYEAQLKEALEQVRINYEQSITLVLGDALKETISVPNNSVRRAI